MAKKKLKTTHGWKKHFRLRKALDAEAVYEIVQRLRAQAQATGESLPRLMWQEAQDPSSPLNPGYTWDVRKAAEERWEEQSRYILQHLIVVTVENVVVQGGVRATQWIPDERNYTVYDNNGEWVDTVESMQDPNTRKRVLTQALRELAAFMQKYEYLEELSDVIRAIKRVTRRK